MKAAYKKYKEAKEQLKFFEKQLSEIDPSKTSIIEAHKHMIEEIRETALNRLSALEWTLQEERNTLQYDHTAINQSA